MIRGIDPSLRRIVLFPVVESEWRFVLGPDFILNWFSAVFCLGFARGVLFYPVSLFDGDSANRRILWLVYLYLDLQSKERDALLLDPVPEFFRLGVQLRVVLFGEDSNSIMLGQNLKPDAFGQKK